MSDHADAPKGQPERKKFKSPQTLSGAKTRTASSASGGSRSRAEHTLDGDPGTTWRATGEAWIGYDLGAVQRLSQLRILWAGNPAGRQPFAVEVSEDGAKWTQAFAGERSGRSDGVEAYILLQPRARHVRLIFPGNASAGMTELAEVELRCRRETVAVHLARSSSTLMPLKLCPALHLLRLTFLVVALCFRCPVAATAAPSSQAAGSVIVLEAEDFVEQRPAPGLPPDKRARWIKESKRAGYGGTGYVTTDPARVPKGGYKVGASPVLIYDIEVTEAGADYTAVGCE